MSGKPLIAVLEAPLMKGRRVTASALLSDYWALTKPEVNFLILITTFVGFYLGCASAGRQFSFLQCRYVARHVARCKRDGDAQSIHRAAL